VFNRQIQICILAVIIWGCALSTVHAAGLEITAETIVRALQRNTSMGSDRQAIPLYQYARIDYGNDEKGSFAFHGYGWMRKGITGKEYFRSDPDGDLLYAYLSYAHPSTFLNLNLGRQHIFAGVANTTIDGLKLDLGLNNAVSLSAYGGSTVGLRDSDDLSTRGFIYGGRADVLMTSAAELGLSYKAIQGDSENREQTAGADFYWSPFLYLSLNGRSSYNLRLKGWREHNYSAQFDFESVSIQPFYRHFQYKDYFGSSKNQNNLFRFLFNSEEALTNWGAEISWLQFQTFEFTLKGSRYDYRVRRTGANFLSGDLSLNLTPDVSAGTELGRMNGKTPQDTYMFYRGYCIWSAKTWLGSSGQISADLLYQSFKFPIYRKDSAFFASMSAGRDLIEGKLRVNASLQYSKDPFFDNDVSGIVTILVKF
jgi:hypothetical protein